MDLNNIEEKMNKTISVLQENLSEVRAGRANPAILNKITVSYYGVPTPINQVAGISVPEARLIVIQPWDATLLKEIEKEILKAEIGINPNNDGKVIRLNKSYISQLNNKKDVENILIEEILHWVTRNALKDYVTIKNISSEELQKNKISFLKL